MDRPNGDPLLRSGLAGEMIDREHELASDRGLASSANDATADADRPGRGRQDPPGARGRGVLADSLRGRGRGRRPVAARRSGARSCPTSPTRSGCATTAIPPLARRLTSTCASGRRCSSSTPVEHLLDGGEAIVGLLEACPSLTGPGHQPGAAGSLRVEQQLVVPPLDLPDPAVGRRRGAGGGAVGRALRRAGAGGRGELRADAENAERGRGDLRPHAGRPARDRAGRGRDADAAARGPARPTSRRRSAAWRCSARGPRDAAGAPPLDRAAAIGWSYRLLEPSRAAPARPPERHRGRLRPGGRRRGRRGRPGRGAAAAAGRPQPRAAAARPRPGPASGLLDTVRDYALDQLSPVDEQAARRGHATWLLELAEQARPALWGPEQMRLVQAARAAAAPTSSAAVRWTIAAGEAELALRLADRAGDYWWLRGHAGAGRAAIEAALARFPDAPAGLRAAALIVAGHLSTVMGEVASAVDDDLGRGWRWPRRPGEPICSAAATCAWRSPTSGRGRSRRPRRRSTRPWPRLVDGERPQRLGVRPAVPRPARGPARRPRARRTPSSGRDRAARPASATCGRPRSRAAARSRRS